MHRNTVSAALIAGMLALGGCAASPADTPTSAATPTAEPTPSEEPTADLSATAPSGAWNMRLEPIETGRYFNDDVVEDTWVFGPCEGDPCSGYIDANRGPRALSYGWDGTALSINRLGDPFVLTLVGCTHLDDYFGLYEVDVAMEYDPLFPDAFDGTGRPTSFIGERTDTAALSAAREDPEFFVNASVCDAAEYELDDWVVELALVDVFARGALTLTASEG